MAKQGLTILVDTREQHPYRFANITPQPTVIRDTLKTGDYSLPGFQNRVVIERKSLGDLYATIGQGRDRFKRELNRMAALDFSAVVIEADWHTILKCPPRHSHLNPKLIYACIVSWQQRYGVHFWPCPNRLFAERTTYRLLERFLYLDKRNGGKWATSDSMN